MNIQDKFYSKNNSNNIAKKLIAQTLLLVSKILFSKYNHYFILMYHVELEYRAVIIFDNTESIEI